MTTVNTHGASNLAACISAGSVDKTSDWSFSADDGNAMLGADGKDWDNYAKWFLGMDGAVAEQTKDRYKYPFGKGGKVYRSALEAIRQRAGQQGDDAVFARAGEYLDKIDGKATRPRTLKAPNGTQRAYSVLKDQNFNDGERIITGIATTPTPDRMQDIVEPLGAMYDLPLPFLWQHDSGAPVGWVTSAKPTKDGIPVTIKMATIDVAGQLKDMVDFAWQSLKSGLVRGLSIGFAPVEYSFLDDSYGIRFIKWNWLELSGVTIPANQEATISTIKSFDIRSRAALGAMRPGTVRLINPDPVVSGKSAARGTRIQLIY